MKALNQIQGALAGRYEQGFTLIEVLIALFIFTVGIIGTSALTTRAFNNFSLSRISTVEVNRDVKNIESLKNMLYFNNQVFNVNGQGLSQYPMDVDQAVVSCWDFNNVVVRDVKFIAAENSRIRGPSASGNYRLYYVKKGNPQIN